ncbi:CBS domain-containing protein [Hoyosella sp. YIM 151337]|uniref:CBS domain-containing protein n=1 Tax=Hoyosella sp. YIM 151337 TaxID=2992742 RepID=UPI002235FC3E|nr:CBS domain-containing protein [Hoyosella sp. YIM 151337]MCW4354011.1 CBS domain-containing protein [Hoyosella sp. YIM 151337]
MRARHIMSSPVTTVDQSASLDECLSILEQRGYTVLPVVNDEERLVGIVSEGDLLREKFRADVQGKTSAEDAMTRPVVTMGPDADVSALASAMLRSRLRGIPIVANNNVIGIVTRRDLLALLTRSDTRIASEIQHRLDVYAGSPEKWRVESKDGTVLITGLSPDDPEREVVAALAETVPGVEAVRFAPA